MKTISLVKLATQPEEWVQKHAATRSTARQQIFTVKDKVWLTSRRTLSVLLSADQNLESIQDEAVIEWCLNEAASKVGSTDFEENVSLFLRRQDVSDKAIGPELEYSKYQQFISLHDRKLMISSSSIAVTRHKQKGLIDVYSSLVPENASFEIPPVAWFDDVQADEWHQKVTVLVEPKDEGWKVRFLKPIYESGVDVNDNERKIIVGSMDGKSKLVI